MSNSNQVQIKNIQNGKTEEENNISKVSNAKEVIINDFINDDDIKAFHLNFNKNTIIDIQNFSKRLHVSQDTFINTIVKFHLEVIASDIEVEEYDILAAYLGLSKILTRNLSDDVEENVDKSEEITINFNSKFKNAINRVCKLIYWEPKRFIEDAIEDRIEIIKDHIHSGNYQFITAFYDLKKVVDSITEILEEDEGDIPSEICQSEGF